MCESIIPWSRSLFQARVPSSISTHDPRSEDPGSLWVVWQNFFIKVSIEKGTFHIHLVEFEVHSTLNWQKDANGLKSNYGSKGFIKVYSFYLSVTLSYQPRLIPYYLAILIHFVFKIHLVLMTWASLGLVTSSHTSFLMNWFNSSCIESIQFSSWRVSSTFFG